MATYLSAKAELIADNHEVIVKGPAKHVTKWTVVDDIKESDIEPVREFFKQPDQVLDFDFGLANRTIKHESGKYEQVNLLSLIRHLKFADMAVLDMLTNELNDGSDAGAGESISSFTMEKSPPAMNLFHHGSHDSQETLISELTWTSGSPSLLSQSLENRRIAHLSVHKMCIETDVVNEGGIIRTARKRCHLCYGKSTKSKTRQYCSAPACQFKARGHGRYWVCQQCWDTHVDEVSAEYDAAK